MVLSTEGYSTPATRTSLEAWVRQYNLPVTSVRDAPSEPRLASQTRYGVRDTVFIVELATMRIVARERWLDSNGSVVARAAPALLRLLRGP